MLGLRDGRLVCEEEPETLDRPGDGVAVADAERGREPVPGVLDLLQARRLRRLPGAKGRRWRQRSKLLRDPRDVLAVAVQGSRLLAGRRRLREGRAALSRSVVVVVGRSLHGVDDREARVAVEAGGGEERSTDVAGEERVATAAIRGRDPFRLGERVDGETAGAFKPALVAGARERPQERETVA